jgi:hypothetical protein
MTLPSPGARLEGARRLLQELPASAHAALGEVVRHLAVLRRNSAGAAKTRHSSDGHHHHHHSASGTLGSSLLAETALALGPATALDPTVLLFLAAHAAALHYPLPPSPPRTVPAGAAARKTTLPDTPEQFSDDDNGEPTAGTEPAARHRGLGTAATTVSTVPNSLPHHPPRTASAARDLGAVLRRAIVLTEAALRDCHVRLAGPAPSLRDTEELWVRY